MGSRFLNDEPTTTDRLGHAPYADALAELCRSGRPPFTVGLYGGWGCGKTSLLQQVEHRLQTAEPRVATLWFNPWRHQFDESPVVALLQDLAATLPWPRRLALRRGSLLRLAGTVAGEALLRALTSGGLSTTDLLQLGVVRESQVRAAQSAVQRLQQALADDVEQVLQARKCERLVVLLDDLDRCRAETAVRVLESLKLFLAADHCVYLLGLDPERLDRSLGGDGGAEAYLDKVVQLPFWIPPPLPERLEAFATDLLGLAASPETARLVAVGAGDNPRRLKRFINSFLLWEPLTRAAVGPDYRRSLHLRLRLIEFEAPARGRALRADPALLGQVWQVLSGTRCLADFDRRRAAELRRWVEDDRLTAILRAAPSMADELPLLPAYLPLPLSTPPAIIAAAAWRPVLLALSDGGERALLVRECVANAWLPSDVHLGRLPTLRGVDLRGADLRDGDLYQSDLRHADLRDADLRGAMLAEADLRGTLLAGADFTGAEVDAVRWPDRGSPSD